MAMLLRQPLFYLDLHHHARMQEEEDFLHQEDPLDVDHRRFVVEEDFEGLLLEDVLVPL